MQAKEIKNYEIKNMEKRNTKNQLKLDKNMAKEATKKRIR